MKVVLLPPPIMDFADGVLRPAEMDAVRVCPPYGMYLLEAVLRAAGHEVVLVDLLAAGTRDLAPYAHHLEGAGLVGISATSLCWATAADVIAQVRARRPDVPIVVGNIHATLFDGYLLERFPIDFVVRGEGEIALPALCRVLETRGDIRTVPNLTWRSPTGPVRNALAPKITSDSLADYPLPDYSALPAGRYRGLALESSRGCALDCSFCSTPYRKSWRGVPSERFVDRLEAILPHTVRTTHGTVHVIDDEFSMNPKRAVAITEELGRRRLSPRLIYDARAGDFLRDGFAEAIAPYTAQFLVGAECGYDEGLARVGKGTTCRILEDAARKVQELGIAHVGEFSFILGLPWEGFDEVLRTIRFAAHLHGKYGIIARLNWYTQMPGSRLWEEDRERMMVCETMYDRYGFYRDLYLFRSGVKLDPRQIWEVYDIVRKLKAVASLHHPGRPTFEFFFPGSIRRYFPPNRLAQPPAATGLASLREIAAAKTHPST